MNCKRRLILGLIAWTVATAGIAPPLHLVQDVFVSQAEARVGGGHSYRRGGGSRRSSGGGSSRRSGSSSSRRNSNSSRSGSGGTYRPNVPNSGYENHRGGDHSYRGPGTIPYVPYIPYGGSVSTDDESDSGADLAQLLAILLIAGAIFYFNRRKSRYDRSADDLLAAMRGAPHPVAQDPYAAIRGDDPAFSAVLFVDFAYALFSRVHEARGSRKLANLSQYLAPALAADNARQIFGGVPKDVREVVIGSIDVSAAHSPTHHRLIVRIEANRTEDRDQASSFARSKCRSAGPAQRLYVVEDWTFVRRRGVSTKPPASDVQVFGCPNCGATSEPSLEGVCKACGQSGAGGTFDWFVESIELIVEKPMPSIELSDAPEVGTDDPTIVQAKLRQRLARLVSADPNFDERAFTQRVTHIFKTLQQAWSTLAWEKARPFETESLFQTHRYWIDQYKRSGMKNVVELTSEPRVEIVKLERDRYFDALTVRIFADCHDFTVRTATGEVVSGSRRKVRRFSEYWTFIRASGTTSVPRPPQVCPSCGVGLEQVSMSGICSSCGSKLTSGKFDWVASRIEQDESYLG